MSALRSLVPALGSLVGSRRIGPLGLELSSERLHLVQMQLGDTPSVRAAVSLPYRCTRDALLSEPARLRRLVAEALSRQPFKGRGVVSSLPAADVTILPVAFRPAAGQDDSALIVRELRERLGAQLDDAVVDYLPIRHDGSDATERSALAAVAPRERVLSHLHLLEKAGLEPIAIDIRPAALARLVGAMSGPSHPNVLLINFGRDRSYLTVLWGKRLMLDRQIEFGERALLAQLRESLNLDDDVAGALLYGDPNAQGQAIGVDAAEVAHTVAEILHPLWTALAGEIDKTLIYVASKTRGQSVQRVLVRGSLARHANCAQFLRRTLAVPVDVLQPLAAFGDSMSIAALPVSDDDGGMALAAGMALRRTDDDD